MIMLIGVVLIVFYLINQGKIDTGGSASAEADAGMEVYLSDANEDLSYLEVTISKVIAVDSEGNEYVLYSGSMPVVLREDVIQKIGAELVPSGNYKLLKIYFTGSGKYYVPDVLDWEIEQECDLIIEPKQKLACELKEKWYKKEAVELQTKIWTVHFDELIKSGETSTVIIDLPLADAIKQLPNKNYIFLPETPSVRFGEKMMNEETRKKFRQKIRERLGEHFSDIDQNYDNKIDVPELEEYFQKKYTYTCPDYIEPSCEGGQLKELPKVGNCQLPPVCVRLPKKPQYNRIDKDNCIDNGGFWNDCGSPCDFTDAEVCIQVCEPRCECGGYFGYTCPDGYICELPNIEATDLMGRCVEGETDFDGIISTETQRSIGVRHG